MKKNRFLTFCFSCIPGVGQMYLGFIKRGFSILLIFCAFSFITSVLYSATWFLPVIWFTSFFDALNIGNKLRLGDIIVDDYLLINDKDLYHVFQIQKDKWSGRVPKYVGVSILCIGVYSLFDQFFDKIMWYLQDIIDPSLYNIIRSFWGDIPQFVVSIIIILIGVHLIKKPKHEFKDDLIEYKLPEQGE